MRTNLRAKPEACAEGADVSEQGGDRAVTERWQASHGRYYGGSGR